MFFQMDDWAVNVLLLRKKKPATSELAQGSGWIIIFCFLFLLSLQCIPDGDFFLDLSNKRLNGLISIILHQLFPYIFLDIFKHVRRRLATFKLS